jgi:hypothetical protein
MKTTPPPAEGSIPAYVIVSPLATDDIAARRRYQHHPPLAATPNGVGTIAARRR